MAAALALTGQQAPGRLTADVYCEGSRFHSPIPLLVEQVDVRGRSVWLYRNCRSVLRVSEHLQEHADGNLDWKVAKEFRTALRVLGEGRRNQSSQ